MGISKGKEYKSESSAKRRKKQQKTQIISMGIQKTLKTHKKTPIRSMGMYWKTPWISFILDNPGAASDHVFVSFCIFSMGNTEISMGNTKKLKTHQK